MQRMLGPAEMATRTSQPIVIRQATPIPFQRLKHGQNRNLAFHSNPTSSLTSLSSRELFIRLQRGPTLLSSCSTRFCPVCLGPRFPSWPSLRSPCQTSHTGIASDVLAPSTPEFGFRASHFDLSPGHSKYRKNRFDPPESDLNQLLS